MPSRRTKKLILAQPLVDQALEYAEQRWDKEHHDCSNAEHAHNLADEITSAAQQEFALDDEDRDEVHKHMVASAVELYGELETEEDRQLQAYEDAQREIEEADCIVINERDEVYWGHSRLGTVGEGEDDDWTWDELWPFLETRMNRRGWYPSIYQVNDHGNITQYSVAGTVLNSWV